MSNRNEDKNNILKIQFLEISKMIEKAKYKTFHNVNKDLIELYWNVGEYVSNKISSSEWGDSVVKNLADFLQKNISNLKGFSEQNIWRMKQFYETYQNITFLSALLREISWTNNLLIMSKSKTPGEREFYIELAIQEKYSSRELERQIDSGLYERFMFFKPKETLPILQNKDSILHSFRDTYVLDFLDLPHNFTETDLRKSITKNLRHFILEFGKDFAFVGEEFRIQVGNNDYFIDLLFFHRELKCLVAFELKIDDFKPEYIGKLNFYLEALDRDVKKEHENPSVGIILCKSKDYEVVEYTLSRSLSPALVAEYKIKLMDKKILQEKLHEFFELKKSKQGNSSSQW